MASGEKTFSTANRTTYRYETKPLEPGDYSLKVLGNTAGIKKKPEPGKFPYVEVGFEVMGTANTEGGKNRKMFHKFFTSTKVSKDGRSMQDKADQIVAYAQAVGETFNAGVITMADEKGNPVDCINPQQLKAWLMNLDGTIVQAHTKIERGGKGNDGRVYNDKAVIDYFIASELADTAGTEAVTDAPTNDDWTDEAVAQAEEAIAEMDEGTPDNGAVPPPAPKRVATRRVAPKQA